MSTPTLPGISASDRAQLERLEDFFKNASVGLHIADAEGRIRSANRALAVLAGRGDAAACEGDRFGDMLVDEYVAGDALARVRRGETVTNAAAALRGAEGDVPVSLNVSGRFEEGELVATRWITRPELAGTIPSVDVTGRAFVDCDPGSDAERWASSLADEVDVRARLAEMSVDEQRDRLAELEDFFEHCPAAIHCVAINGDVVKANRTDLANVGYLEAPEEYLGHHVKQVYADQALLDDLLVRLSAGTPIVNVRAELRRRDGGLFPVIVYSSGRVWDGRFENTRCVVFADPDPEAERTSLRRFSWPPRA